MHKSQTDCGDAGTAEEMLAWEVWLDDHNGLSWLWNLLMDSFFQFSPLQVKVKIYLTTPAHALCLWINIVFVLSLAAFTSTKRSDVFLIDFANNDKSGKATKKKTKENISTHISLREKEGL